MDASQTPYGVLADLFLLEPVEVNTWQTPVLDLGMPQAFGGQLVAQSLVAASRVVTPGKAVHASYTSFLRGGRADEPLRVHAEVLREGRQQASVRVSLRQRAGLVAETLVTAGTRTDGIGHQRPWRPDHSPAEAIELSEYATSRGGAMGRWAELCGVEVRVAPQAVAAPHSAAPVETIWMRARGRLSDHTDEHRAALGYASDLLLMSMAAVPHGVPLAHEQALSRDWWGVSLDHALWFGADFRADEWFALEHSTSMAAHGRAVVEGAAFTTDGRMVARVTQQALVQELS